MREYKVAFTVTGALSQLPDSQRLFGALVCMFSEKYGGDKAAMLVKAVLHKKIHLALSNVMPLDYLPMPQDYLVGAIAETAEADVGLKTKRAAIKERNYITAEGLNAVLAKPDSGDGVFPYVKLVSQQQAHMSIESERYDIPGLDNKLFSVPTVGFIEISGAEEKAGQTKSVNKFCFYLQADDSEACGGLAELLEAAVKEKRSIGLGKRVSQGLNTFRFLSIDKREVQHPPTGLFLNMGMLLPDEIDFAASTLKLFTSERRPFAMLGGWDKDFTKHYISFIAEGSVISALNGLENAGKSLVSPFNAKRDIIFGNAFLYPVSISGRRG